VRADERGLVMVYAAAPIREDDHILSVVQVSSPLTTAQSLIANRRLTLAGGVIALTLLALAASLWLAASFTRPLGELRRSALTLASGNFSHRVDMQRADEFGELAQTFDYMAQEVEAMVEEQRAFASNASHELRTPLTTIRLRSEALREGTLDADTAAEYIAEIDDEAARLGYLVNELILLSRLDANRAQLGTDMVDIAPLVHRILREYEQQISEKAITVKSDLPDDLPAIAASLGHVRIALQNLLSNALKFTPADGRIDWVFRSLPDAVEMTITDTGQGIVAEDLPHLFERFYRADKARTRTAGGTGLGLTLVQSIVHLYGGQISIESPGLGLGTTVTVIWPLPAQP
jgi:signal transduction histidine kinase